MRFQNGEPIIGLHPHLLTALSFLSFLLWRARVQKGKEESDGEDGEEIQELDCGKVKRRYESRVPVT